LSCAEAQHAGEMSLERLWFTEHSSAVSLWVDPAVHAAEYARSASYIVASPTERDCDLWVAAIGPDGYEPTRDGVGRCVRPNRYALALASGVPLAGEVLALHER
jgi:hypothetical protein